MRRLEGLWGVRQAHGCVRALCWRGSARPLLGLLAALLCASPPSAEANDAANPAAGFRHQAVIVVEQPAAFVRLPLPVSVYAHSRQPNLADLRLVDARGERVPFALLAPRPAQPQEGETLRPAAMYALPPIRPGEAEPRSPIEVQVVGERITVRRLAATTAVVAAPAGAPSPGWLFDLGERDGAQGGGPAALKPASAPSVPAASSTPWPVTALRLAWSMPAEFSAAYELAVSDDLRQWRAAGGGQVLALESVSGRLTQPNVPLPAGAPRFVRLRWLDAAQAPRLTGAQAVQPQRQRIVLDPPTALVVPPQAMASPGSGSAGPSPGASAGPGAGATGGTAATTSTGAPAAGAGDDAPGAQTYDLGAALPVLEIDLALPPGQRVAPVRVQGRVRENEPWRDLGQTVFYRLERAGAVDRPPALAIHATVRQLRLVPDARSGALPPVPLTVQAQLSSLVFAAQGQPPYRLLAGSSDTAPGALPIGTLVPALDDERPRLGRATLGTWAENEAVAREEARRQRLTEWRPFLLWGVLLVGVGLLGVMVWRLARRPPA